MREMMNRLGPHLCSLLLALAACATAPTRKQVECRSEVAARDLLEAEEIEAAYRFHADPTAEHVAEALNLLQTILDDLDRHSARSAAIMLSTIGEYRLEQGRMHVLRALQLEPDSQEAGLVVDSAALALARLGGGSAAVSELASLANSEYPETRRAASVALGLLDHPDAAAALVRLAGDAIPSVRSDAIKALAAFCEQAERRLILDAMKDSNEDVSASALFWVAECGGPQDEGVLARYLADPTSQNRLHALRGLLRIGSRYACPRLSKLLVDSSMSVRKVAAEYVEVCKSGSK